MWLAVSCFMEMGLVSGLSLANHSDSESFLVVHAYDEGPETPRATREASGVPFLRQDEA